MSDRGAPAAQPSPTRPDELEGCGVRSRIGLLGAAAFFLFIGVSIGGLYAFYRASGSPHVNVVPAEHFPAPRLNTKLDSDPQWSFAPPNPLGKPPDADVQRAMRTLAARGEAGYAPLAPSPGAGTPSLTGPAAGVLLGKAG